MIHQLEAPTDLGTWSQRRTLPGSSERERSRTPMHFRSVHRRIYNRLAATYRSVKCRPSRPCLAVLIIPLEATLCPTSKKSVPRGSLETKPSLTLADRLPKVQAMPRAARRARTRAAKRKRRARTTRKVKAADARFVKIPEREGTRPRGLKAHLSGFSLEQVVGRSGHRTYLISPVPEERRGDTWNLSTGCWEIARVYMEDDGQVFP
ncbi:hypothetical protein QBC47DRAFT_366618, partial [Echria macrotheca]